jgi:hypothetical protein
VRYGWHTVMVPALLLCGVLIAFGVWAWRDAPWLGVFFVVFFGGQVLWMMAGAVLGPLAVRVGPAGVALCARPVRGEVWFVPWPDVAAVVVAEVGKGWRRRDRVWVVRRDEPLGIAELPDREAAGAALIPGFWAEPTRPVTAYTWPLDVDRLRRAVELNAPEVRLVDARLSVFGPPGPRAR